MPQGRDTSTGSEVSAGIKQPRKRKQKQRRERVTHSERREVRSIVTSKPERPQPPLPVLPDTANTRGRERARIQADMRRRYPHKSRAESRREAILGFLVDATKAGLKAEKDWVVDPNVEIAVNLKQLATDPKSRWREIQEEQRERAESGKPATGVVFPSGGMFGPRNVANRMVAKYGKEALKETPPGPAAAHTEQYIEKRLKRGKKKEPESEHKVASVLPEAKKVRGVQKAAWRPVRGERFSATEKEFGAAGGGLKGLHAATSQMRGELPKIPFARLREIGYSKKELDRDINRIFEHPELTRGDKLAAGAGLRDMALHDVVPQGSQIEHMVKVFGPEKTAKLFIKSIPQHLMDIFGLSRSLMTVADVSRLLRQSLLLAFRNPKMWAESIPPQMKALGSESKFQASREARFADEDFQELERIMPELLTDIEGRAGLGRSEFYPSTLAEKLNVPIPGTKNVPLIRGRVGPGRVVRASGRSFEEGQLDNILRSYKAMKKRAEKWGVNINPHTPDGLRELRGMAEVAGAQVRRGIFKSKGGKKSQWLAGKSLFAPSFYKGTLTWFSPRWYYKLPKVARYEAIRTMGQFLGGSAAILYGATKLGADVATDPRSTDFAKIRIGDTRLDTLGGFQQWARLARQIQSGQYIDTETGEVIDMQPGIGNRTRRDTLLNFATTKLSPPASFINDLFAGTDYQHRPFEWKRAVVQRMTPLVLQDMLTVYGHTGSVPAAAAAYAGAGAGIGVQTYTRTSRDEKARKEWQTRTEAAWKKKGHTGPLPLALVRKYENSRLVSQALQDTKKELGLERVDEIPVKDQAKAYVTALVASNPRLKQYQDGFLREIDATADLSVEKDILPALRRRLGLNVQIADLRK